MLLIRHAFHGVVDHLAIAIEGEAIFDVAPDAEDGHRFVAGGISSQPVGQRTRGVGAIQQVNHLFGCADGWNAEDRTDAIKIKDQHDQHGSGDQAQPNRAEAFNHDDDQQRSTGGGQQSYG